MRYSYNYSLDGGRKKNKFKKIIFVAVICIIVTVIAGFMFKNSNNNFFRTMSGIITKPFDIFFDATSNFSQGISSHFADEKKLTQEKEKLESEKKELEYKVLETEKILQENESLKNMLDIKNKFQHLDIKLGKIIYREHDNWTQTFAVDIGTEDGVALNQAVVHEEGLVGYVSEVSATRCTVTTILDPSSSVSVNISTINEPAILQGDLSLKSNNRLKLTFIPIDAEISISDMLYTSGLGSTYPNAIPVGKIIEVVNNKNDTNRYAIVEPNVNIRTISEVGIIIN